MINIILSGCNGQMGQVIARLLDEDDSARVVCGFDINTEMKNSFPVYDDLNNFDGEADVIIDFSHPNSLEKLLAYSKKRSYPIVIATTGLSSHQIDDIKNHSKYVATFRSANMSLGMNLIIGLAKKAAAILEGNFDIEIIEKHHNKKIDAPSGTALMIADEISSSLKNEVNYVYDRHSVRKKRSDKEIGIHAVRGGTIVGDHSIIFAGNDEVIEISHSAASKEIFAVGSIKAAKFLCGKAPGLYEMKHIINS